MTRYHPITDSLFGGVFSLLAEGWSHPVFAPWRAIPLGKVTAPADGPRPPFWDRVDRWAWKQVQKDREAYLARSENLVDLERRIRALDSVRGRLF